MYQIDAMKSAVDLVRKEAGDGFLCQEEALIESLSEKGHKSYISIIAVTVAGGTIGAVAFLGFLFTIKFYEHAIAALATGIIMFLFSVFHSHLIKKKISETISLSVFLVGNFLIGVSCMDEPLLLGFNYLLLVFTIIAIVTLIWTRSKILAFIAKSMLIGCAVGFLFENKLPNLIHLITIACSLISGALFVFEANVLAMRNRLSEIYEPVRYATTFGGLGGLEFFSGFHWAGFDERFLWLSSIVPLVWSFVILYPLLQNHTLIKWLVAVALIAVGIASPTMISALSVLLIGFGFSNKLLMFMGGWSLVNSITQFYLNLNISLLNKSMVLMLTGMLFLAAYIIIHKSTKANEG